MKGKYIYHPVKNFGIKSFRIKTLLIFILVFNTGLIYPQHQIPRISITIDDPTADSADVLSWHQKNGKLLKTLQKYNIKAALFVCGKRINSIDGFKLLDEWNNSGHMICNHSYSHSYFHSKKINAEIFKNDFLKCDSIIKKYSGYTKLFRFPYLKEGDTKEKRDEFRQFLFNTGYRNGSVTIDASDWYVSSRMCDTLNINKDFDITPFKQYYIEHIYSRALFYDSLAFQLTGRKINHTLLLHYNVLNAMFLDDLIVHFISKGWEIINADDAFSDEIFSSQPDILPAGESLVWALAKETGKFDNILRYPGEDSFYEETGLNEFLFNYYSKKNINNSR